MKGFWVIGAVLAVAGCAPERAADGPGKVIFDSYCAACHGKGAQGDGPLATDLPVAPPDLTLLANRNGGAFPVQAVMTQIYGYPGRFHRGLMPEFGPLLEGPSVDWQAPGGEIVPTPKALLDLVAYLETIQQ